VRPGDIVSKKYRLHHCLARGGMGEVWAAHNLRTERDVAVKILRHELASSQEALERFVQEARATGRLRHPSLVHVFDAGVTRDARPYLVMELLDGESLEQRLEREGYLSQLTSCIILSPVVAAVRLAHEAGIVHRDLSSANIFLAASPDGGDPVPKILDFGVSKMLGTDGTGRVRTQHGALLGSPAFMSPEQVEGAETADARSDIWSLGALLYLCLSGRTPFTANNPNTLMLAIITRPHPPLRQVAPGVDAELAALVEACLAKDRDARLQTAAELEHRLLRVGRRIARHRETSHFAPQRRATDRLCAAAALAATARRGTLAWPPKSLRLRQRPRWLRRPLPRGPVAAISGLLGLGLGLFLGVQLAAGGALPAARHAFAASVARPNASRTSEAAAAARSAGPGRAKRAPAAQSRSDPGAAAAAGRSQPHAAFRFPARQQSR
jgi:serine/threonine protein kinase